MNKGTEFVNNWLEAVNRGDLDALVRKCHPDVEFSNPDGAFRGYEGVRVLFKAIIDATSEREYEVSNIVEAGNTVVVEFTFRARSTGPLSTPQGTLPATNKTTSLSTITVFELRDGKLINQRGYYDRLTLMSPLGLIGTPAPA